MPNRERMVRRDYTDTVRDLHALLIQEANQRPENEGLVKSILKSVDELANEIKEQREEIIALKLKAEHIVSRKDVEEIAANAVKVTSERVDNLRNWVAAIQSIAITAILFIANKVFHGG